LEKDLPPLNNEEKVEGTLARKKDVVKEEKEPPCHEDAGTDSEGNPIEVITYGSNDEPN